jgi:hypothetical protein
MSDIVERLRTEIDRVAREDELAREIKRLRLALKQIAIDCAKVQNDEICSEAERRTWRAVERFALGAIKRGEK